MDIHHDRFICTDKYLIQWENKKRKLTAGEGAKKRVKGGQRKEGKEDKKEKKGGEN